MPIPVARVGDTFEGYCTRCDDDPYVTGTITTGEFVQLDDRNIAVLGSLCTASCGHTGTLIATSEVLFVEDKPVGRLGDAVTNFSNSRVTSASDTLASD